MPHNPCHTARRGWLRHGRTDALKSSSSYAVFVRRDDTARKFLHNTFGLVSAAVCVYRFPQKFDGMRNYAVDAVAAIRA